MVRFFTSMVIAGLVLAGGVNGNQSDILNVSHASELQLAAKGWQTNIVLIHGLASDASAWDKIAPLLAGVTTWFNSNDYVEIGLVHDIEHYGPCLDGSVYDRYIDCNKLPGINKDQPSFSSLLDSDILYALAYSHKDYIFGLDWFQFTMLPSAWKLKQEDKNQATYNVSKKKQKYSNYRVFAINFSNNKHLTFNAQGDQLKHALEEIKDITGVSDFILIGHSMGGLAARAYIQNESTKNLKALFTIGTPHTGGGFGSGFYTWKGNAAINLGKSSKALADLNNLNTIASKYADIDVFHFGYADNMNLYGSDHYTGGDGVVDIASQMGLNELSPYRVIFTSAGDGSEKSYKNSQGKISYADEVIFVDNLNNILAKSHSKILEEDNLIYYLASKIILLDGTYSKPTNPSIQVSTNGTKVTLSWSADNADKYTLWYAPYPSGSPLNFIFIDINSIDMGTATSSSFDLPIGSAYIMAITASNNFGTSELSNIEYFDLQSADDIQLDKYSVAVRTGDTETIIGNGGYYTATTTDNQVATVDVDDDKITITGVSTGNATVIVKDLYGNTTAVSVMVVKNFPALGTWDWDLASGEACYFNENKKDCDNALNTDVEGFWTAESSSKSAFQTFTNQLCTAVLNVAEKTVNSGYAYDEGYFSYTGVYHSGIDITADVNEPVFSPINGKVYEKVTGKGHNNRILIQEKNSSRIWIFGHMTPLDTWGKGDTIDEGDTLGNIHSHSSGTHLHIEVKKESGDWMREDERQLILDENISPMQAYYEYLFGPEIYIVFLSKREGNWEVYSIDYSLKNITNLTNNPADDLLPELSPDGKSFAFVSDRDGNNEIYLTNVSEKTTIRLTDHPADDGGPTWSPDGKKIAFVSERDENYEIYTLTVEGSGDIKTQPNPQRITDNANDDLFPSWSPDGEILAFVSNRDGNYEIYIVVSDGRGIPYNLTKNECHDTRPSFSPDGEWIAYLSDCDNDFDLWKIGKFGGIPQKLTTQGIDEVGHFDWSPDGTKIAFDSKMDGDYEIYIIDSDGTNLQKLTDNTASDRFATWTNDGQKIVCVSNREGNDNIYLLEISGDNPINISNDPSDNTLTKYSPVYDDGGGCFIATAAFGSYFEPHVMVLREYRDRVMLPTKLGRRLVSLYYQISPPIADLIRENPLLKFITRLLLTPLVYGIKYPLFFGVIMFVIAFGAWRREKLICWLSASEKIERIKIN